MNEDHPVSSRTVASIIHIVMELAAIYPLLVLLDAYVLRTGMSWNWVLLLFGSAGIGTLLRPMQRLNGLVTGISFAMYAVLVSVALYGILAASSIVTIWLAVSVLAVSALLRGIMIARGNMERLFPIRWQLVALGLTWIVYIVAGSSSSIDDGRASLYVAGAFTLFALLFRFAGQQIEYISLDEGFSFASLRAVIQRTRRWTWLVVVLIAILGASDQLSLWLEQAWKAVVAWLSNTSAPPPALPTDTYTPPPLEPLQLPEASSSTTDPFWIEKIAQLIVLLAVCAFIGWLGLVIIRLLRRYAPKLYRWLLSLWEPQQLRQEVVATVAYTDEVQQLNEPARHTRRWFARTYKPSQPDERVRYYYRQLLSRASKQGITIAASATPERVGRQLAPEQYANRSTLVMDESARQTRIADTTAGTKELIELYNRVRYDGQPVAEQELAQWEQRHHSSNKR
ncbi:DUF4129 domain-containing protein [Paenibacillus campi]|uniref:DUF4129 domain-containing protein n=1 Tax=Paenibacillus campi TaxID=3106031 RepID=UPI002AFE3AAE|nr:DUF4129 domain-containing protein [Paenibacillus sp. SGZ-1009]